MFFIVSASGQVAMPLGFKAHHEMKGDQVIDLWCDLIDKFAQGTKPVKITWGSTDGGHIHAFTTTMKKRKPDYKHIFVSFLFRSKSSRLTAKSGLSARGKVFEKSFAESHHHKQINKAGILNENFN